MARLTAETRRIFYFRALTEGEPAAPRRAARKIKRSSSSANTHVTHCGIAGRLLLVRPIFPARFTAAVLRGPTPIRGGNDNPV